MTAVIHIQPEEGLPSVRASDSDLATTPCPLCNSTVTSIIHIFDPFHVVSCSECGMIYLNPRLKQELIDSLYRGDTYFSRSKDTGYEDYGFQEQSLRMTFRRFLSELDRRGITGGRLLEVGCGYGYFLEEAKDFFPSLAGTELSEKAGMLAKQRTGADIFIGDVDAMSADSRDFDTVVLINVIEHIYAPVSFLSALAKRMKSSGTIVLATPDIGSFWHRIMKSNWPSFKIPEHIAFYNERTLTSLLEKSGFRNISQIPFPHAFPLGLIFSKVRLSAPVSFRQRPVWLPKTMIALSGKVL